jgi:endoglucanase
MSSRSIVTALAVTAVTLVTGATVTQPTAPAVASVTQAETGCAVTVSQNDVFIGDALGIAGFTVKNGATALSGWQLEFTVGAEVRVTNLFFGSWSQSGTRVTVNSLPWNGNVPAGGQLSQFSFYSRVAPGTADLGLTAFTLNGAPCAVTFS